MPAAVCKPEYLAEHYNGRIFKCYYVYICARYGRHLFEDVCRELEIDVDFLIDSANWFSEVLSREFMKAVKIKTGDSHIATSAGRLFASPEVLSLTEYILVSAAPSVFWFLRLLPYHYAKFNRINEIKVTRLVPGECAFEVKPRGSIQPSHDVCLSTRSMLMGTRNLFEVENINVEHDQCIHRGDAVCEFKVRYSKLGVFNRKLKNLAIYVATFATTWLLLRCLLNPVLPVWVILLTKIIISSAISIIPLLVLEYLKKLNLISLYYSESREISEKLYRERVVCANNEAIVGFARQVSHDLRSPLAALETAVSDYSQIDRELALAATKRIGDLTRGILDSSGVNPSRLSRCNLNKIIDNVVKEKMANEIKLNGEARIEFEPDRSDAFLETDSSGLTRLVSNLLDNAIDAISIGGNIKILTVVTESNVSLIIRDNGCGIDYFDLPHVGRRGFTKGKAAGNGLGLSQVRKFVDDAKGELTIDSKIGKGTTVTIRLPKFTVSVSGN